MNSACSCYCHQQPVHIEHCRRCRDWHSLDLQRRQMVALESIAAAVAKKETPNA